MQNKLGFTSSLFLFLPFTVSCSSTAFEFITIDFIYDGDTFKYQNQKIRLFGVDTPETTKGSPTFESTSGLEALYAQKAKIYVQNWLQNQKVRLEEQTTDKYNRLVAKVIGQEDLGLNLIKNGLARVAYISLEAKSPYFTNDFSYYQSLLNAQYFAYTNNLGLWVNKESFKIIFPKAN